MSVVQETTGSIFDNAPDNCVLIHACNAKGTWGGGVAATFRTLYPSAYRKYHDHCCPSPAELEKLNRGKPAGGKQTLTQYQRALVGTTLLIAPCEVTPKRTTRSAAAPAKQHYIACLFTSNSHGANVDPPTEILEATRTALENMVSQLQDIDDQKPTECRAVRINSGLFRVPWEDIKAVMEEIFSGSDAEGLSITIYSPAPTLAPAKDAKKGGDQANKKQTAKSTNDVAKGASAPKKRERSAESSDDSKEGAGAQMKKKTAKPNEGKKVAAPAKGKKGAAESADPPRKKWITKPKKPKTGKK